MNWLENTILAISPAWGAQRLKNKLITEQMRGYDAAKPGRNRKKKLDNRSGDNAVYGSAESIRGQARYLDENHDLVVGLLDKLSQKVVGPKGISIEPMPFTVAGEKHEEFAQQLTTFFDKLSMAPETTGELTRGQVENLVCRSWLRDGECFGKYIEGNVPNFKHNTDIPFSVELLEADFLPFTRNDNSRIVQGVERNAWGQPLAYHFLENHPGDSVGFSSRTFRIPADKVLHIKLTNRIRQARGMSILHSVIIRLEDLKDYEESERVAARISAVLAAYIKKAPTEYGSDNTPAEDRLFSMGPGMFFDDLMPGEEVGTIESNRPSALLQPFRDSMLRAVASGTRSTFSSISGQYDGSYSSQRQEMVEGYAGYESLQQIFIGKWSRPFYRRALRLGIAAGLIEVPADVDPETIFNAVYLCPVMPWIDPDKESKANERNIKMGIETEASVVRSKGKNPQEVKRQRMKEIQFNKDNDLIFSSDARHELQQETPTEQPPKGADDAE
jgi:lambda family phage portal protein